MVEPMVAGGEEEALEWLRPVSAWFKNAVETVARFPLPEPALRSEAEAQVEIRRSEAVAELFGRGADKKRAWIELDCSHLAMAASRGDEALVELLLPEHGPEHGALIRLAMLNAVRTGSMGPAQRLARRPEALLPSPELDAWADAKAGSSWLKGKAGLALLAADLGDPAWLRRALEWEPG